MTCIHTCVFNQTEHNHVMQKQNSSINSIYASLPAISVIQGFTIVYCYIGINTTLLHILPPAKNATIQLAHRHLIMPTGCIQPFYTCHHHTAVVIGPTLPWLNYMIIVSITNSVSVHATELQ